MLLEWKRSGHKVLLLVYYECLQVRSAIAFCFFFRHLSFVLYKIVHAYVSLVLRKVVCVVPLRAFFLCLM